MNLFAAQHSSIWTAFSRSQAALAGLAADPKATAPQIIDAPRGVIGLSGPSSESVSLSAAAHSLFSRESSGANTDVANGGFSPLSQAPYTYSADGKIPKGLDADALAREPYNRSSDSINDKESAREQTDEKSAEQSLENEKERQAETQKQEAIRDLASRTEKFELTSKHMPLWEGLLLERQNISMNEAPDGVNYAVGGEVPIDVSPAATPEQTIAKAQTIRRAALAPAEPSPQDRRVAQESTRLEAQARQEVRAESIDEKELNNSNVDESKPALSAEQNARAEGPAAVASGALAPVAAPTEQNSISGADGNRLSSIRGARSVSQVGAETYRALSQLTGLAARVDPSIGSADQARAPLLNAKA